MSERKATTDWFVRHPLRAPTKCVFCGAQLKFPRKKYCLPCKLAVQYKVRNGKRMPVLCKIAQVGGRTWEYEYVWRGGHPEYYGA